MLKAGDGITIAWAVIDDARGDGTGLPYATHHGVLCVGDAKLRVYQLNTGQAIIHADDMEAFMAWLAAAE